MPFLVTITADLVNVSLPNGTIAQGGDVVLLSDAQYMSLSPTAAEALFSSVVTSDLSSVPETSQSALTPELGDNPYAESSSPIVDTTYTATSPGFLEEG